MGIIGFEPIQQKHQFYRLTPLSNLDVFPFSFETRMRVELIKTVLQTAALTIQPPCLYDIGKLSIELLTIAIFIWRILGACSIFKLQYLLWRYEDLHSVLWYAKPLFWLGKLYPQMLRKKWESNPHESLTPNSFQDCGHRQLACPSLLLTR